MSTRQTLVTDGLLLATAAIWGFAFAAQRAGMSYVGPFTYNAVRFSLGALSLVPLLILIRKRARKVRLQGELPENTEPDGSLRLDANQRRVKSVWKTLLPGVAAGVVLFAGSSLQQVGIVYTTAGKAGFITGLYVVIVPILGTFLGRMTDRGRWAGALLAAAGMYFLSVTETFTIERGDFLVFLCAFMFAGHVLLLSVISPRMEPVTLSVIQYGTTAILSAVVALFTEAAALSSVLAAWLPIVYGGIFSVGIAYSLQVVAQKTAHPAHAAIILSLEGAFAALGGFLVLGELLTPRDILGCVLMLSGMVAAQAGTIRASMRERRKGRLTTT